MQEKYGLRLQQLEFNPKPATCMHIDLNSCFATIEQQANPLLRGKPIAVAAYTTPSGCILAPSIEAKQRGVSVGMRVKEGKLLCPELVVLSPDPWKYRFIHLKLKELLCSYTDALTAKSIDEFVLDFEGYPALALGMRQVANEIKERIKKEIGDWLRVSIGIAPNRFLAKMAAGLHKPDGLDEINQFNYQEIYQSLELTDICGIKSRNAARLNQRGIFSVIDFYQADVKRLIAAFESIAGYYWYIRLHGFEIDDVLFGRRSYGNSYALPKPLIKDEEIAPVLMKLVTKMSQRLRKSGHYAQGTHLSLLFAGGNHWHMGKKTSSPLFDTGDIYRHIFRIYQRRPYIQPITHMAVSCFHLAPTPHLQLDLLSPTLVKEQLSEAIDALNFRYGDYVVTPGLMLGTAGAVPDRIAFGGMKELEELVLA